MLLIEEGWLLHQVLWPKLYIRKHFGENAIIVFNGYATKDKVHRRRKNKKKNS